MTGLAQDILIYHNRTLIAEKGQRGRGLNRFRWSAGQHITSECDGCGYEHGRGRQTCRQCHKKGHFKLMYKNVLELAADHEDFAIDSVFQCSYKPWTINTKIKETDVPFRICTWHVRKYKMHKLHLMMYLWGSLCTLYLLALLLSG